MFRHYFQKRLLSPRASCLRGQGLRAHSPGVPSDIPPMPPSREPPDIIVPPQIPPPDLPVDPPTPMPTPPLPDPPRAPPQIARPGGKA